jgi:hypothetical protein
MSNEVNNARDALMSAINIEEETNEQLQGSSGLDLSSTGPTSFDNNNQIGIWDDPYKDGKVGFPEETRKNDMTNTFGLNQDIPKEHMDEIKAMAFNNLTKQNAWNIDLNLNEDDTKIPGCNYMVTSFVGPDMTAKSQIYGLCFLGAFETVEEAVDYIDDACNKTYDTGIVEMYKFTPNRPSMKPETQEDVDKFLNDVIVKYKIEREEARLVYEYRKEKLMVNENRFVENEEQPPEIDFKNANKLAEEASKITNQARDKTHARLKEKLRQRQEATKTAEGSATVAESTATKTTEGSAKTVEHTKVQQMPNLPKKHLTGSNNRIDGQNYVALSYVGNTGNNNRVAMKIRGVFDKYEECAEFCKELQEVDNDYDIVVADMYRWLPCDPDVSKIQNQVHDDEQLNRLISTSTMEPKVAKKLNKEFDVVGSAVPTGSVKKILDANEASQLVPDAVPEMPKNLPDFITNQIASMDFSARTLEHTLPTTTEVPAETLVGTEVPASLGFGSGEVSNHINIDQLETNISTTSFQ